ncbi:MAG: hypothetical protein Hyperionvirus19_22 [Hyperionvirus sp.]|uniref:GIY-YIG domain-containing protein n=1 Tax=Hyperionvirus sp. TaxID=2487770 RepID=A0A3G5AAC6_9VIRU|nr:MAG: hypothetical protein Hyperionvirus19_22 [Hyperionvirus sp.]
MIYPTASPQFKKYLSKKSSGSFVSEDATPKAKASKSFGSKSSKETPIKKSKFYINESVVNEELIPLKPFPPSVFERYKVNFDITQPIESQIPPLEMGKGEIYISTNSFDDKIYVGQADNYINGNTPFGGKGRWVTHQKGARSTQDGCPHFYNAIRKYGVENFTVHLLLTAPLSEMDHWEKFYIQLFNSMSDNGHGYNLIDGGKKNRVYSKASRKKMSLAKIGKVSSAQARKNISLAQMGKRLPRKKRKYAEDENLPTYIVASRRKGVIVGYYVKYPIGVKKLENIWMTFSNAADPDKALEDAKKQLAEWEIKYKDIDDQIKEMKEEHYKNKTTLSLEQKYNKRNPPYIFCKMADDKIRGYFVRGFPDHKGNPYAEKEFSELTKNWDNKRAAKRYIESLKIKNQDAVFKEYIPQEIAEWAEEEKNKCPKRMRRYAAFKHLAPNIYYSMDRVTNQILGYKIAFPKSDGSLYNEMFTSAKLTMEEKYKQATDKLIELIHENNDE